MSTNLTTLPDHKAPVAFGNAGVELKSLEDAWRFAKAIHDSGLAPKAYKDGRTADQATAALLVVMQTGLELGYTPMQAVRNMWPSPDGRPNEYVEASWARVLASGLVEEWSEEFTDESATFRVLRKGSKTPVVSTFTIAQAMRAGLIKDGGNWKKYPERMLKARAKGYALKDAFPDVLRGMSIAEVTDEFFRGSERARDITPPRAPDPLIQKLGLATDVSEKASDNDPKVPINMPEKGEIQQTANAEDNEHAQAADGRESGYDPGPGSESPSAASFWANAPRGKSGHFRFGLSRPSGHGDQQETRYFSTIGDWCAALCELADETPEYMEVWDANVNVHAALVKDFPDELSQGHLKAVKDHIAAALKADEAVRRGAA
jgi:hypothetical protein